VGHFRKSALISRSFSDGGRLVYAGGRMRIHVTAVAGTGMGALAGLLKELGHEVSGSDVAFYPPMGPALESWGIELKQGFRAEHLGAEAAFGRAPEVVVVGNVCRKDNVEAVEAERLGLRRLHIGSALQEFALPGTAPLVVAGTHGKTTTSSLCAHLLDRAGLEPGFLIGGIPKSLGKSFRAAGKRPLGLAGGPQRRKRPFVLEGDEYDTAFWEKTAKFLHYRAEVAIVTSVEHDHVDIYPTLASYRAPFRAFVAGLPKDGLLLAWAGSAEVRALAAEAPCEVAYYAVEGDEVAGLPVHWLAAPAQTSPEGLTFDLYAGGVLAGRFLSPLPGVHNLRNAVAAIAAAAQGYGADLKSLGPALAEFTGIKRRQELLGTPAGVAVYDDFAHHPTAVRETLAALRARHPQSRLIAVFEPRSATACRQTHQVDYEGAFDAADLVLLASVHRKDIAPGEQLDVARLAGALAARGRRAACLPSSQDILSRLIEEARPGDVVAILSNGAFDGLHTRLLAALAPQNAP